MAKKPTSHILLLSDEHSGRDEMNLAGHPFALLQRPQRCRQDLIFYEWKRIVDGREVTASWRVGTDAEFGLPGPEEEMLYLVLMQLTREAAEAAGTPRDWPTQVQFSRRDILRRLSWNYSKRQYAALDLAFNRLQMVNITARHAFYDARTQKPLAKVSFGLLDSHVFTDEPNGRRSREQLPLSHFEWNTILHTSFLAGNVRSLALDFLISLQHPISRRLFRLLDVLRYASRPPRPQLSMGLFKLRDRLGMTEYKYPSQILQKLAPAIEELTACGYLAGMSVEKDKEGGPMAVFRFASPFKIADALAASSAKPSGAPASPTSPTSPASPSVGFGGSLSEIILPDFGVRWVPEVELTEQERQRIAALDALFESLPADQKAKIEERALADLPQFLRENLRHTGAQIELKRTRRREVAARYGR